ncbi:NAD(P)H-dependent oxidoreductase [Phenylobacterium sp. LjRoot219]|uniref:FMN-dependent NADH-azoreductase n=1 Tax=Phenylobacterium sp. LjRoot219 TaxID=3342283 RepID=UPI003ECF7603
MKLLHIDAGITGDASVSRQLSAAIVQAVRDLNPGAQVARRDLDAEPIPHLDSRNLGELATDDGAILREFLDADVVVIGAPMYNFGIPSQLKAWFDRVLVAGKTFRYTANGPEGLAGGKRVIIASARGGLYAPGTPQAAIDFHEPHLRALFRMIGIDEVTIVRAEGVAISPDHRAAALEAALAALPDVAAEFTQAVAA